MKNSNNPTCDPVLRSLNTHFRLRTSAAPPLTSQPKNASDWPKRFQENSEIVVASVVVVKLILSFKFQMHGIWCWEWLVVVSFNV